MKRSTTKAQIFCIALILIASFSFAQQITFDYVCPAPGSKYLNPEQNIILNTSASFDQDVLSDAYFNIRGSKSGINNFELLLSEDRRTLLINPTQKFRLDEEIFVIVDGLQTANGRIIQRIDLNFFIKEK